MVPTLTVVMDCNFTSSTASQHGQRMRNACWLHVSCCSMQTKARGARASSLLWPLDRGKSRDGFGV